MGFLWVLFGIVFFSLAEAGLTIVMYQKLGLSWTFGILLISIIVSGGLEYISRKRWKEKQKHSNPQALIEILEEEVQDIIFIYIFVFLLFPGMLTDLFGLLLLVPLVRNPIIRSMSRFMLKDCEQNPGLGDTFLKMNRGKKERLHNQ
ncbi:MAG: FxsA family protein [Acidobacteria bacterium]|nr:FxsA family protein [Acidobacteriota bacterium]